MSKMSESIISKFTELSGNPISLIIVLILLHSVAVHSLAQAEIVVVKADTNACELNSLNLDIIRVELANDPSARLIVRTYGGQGERLPVNQKRIAHVRKFLKDSKGFDSTRMKFINKRTHRKIEPRLEFFLQRGNKARGEIFLIMYSKRNRTPCLDCCSDKEFAPKIIGL